MVGLLDNILNGTGNQNSKGGLLGFLNTPYASGLTQGLLSGQGNFAQNVGVGMGIGNQYLQQDLKNKFNQDRLGLSRNLTEAQIQNLKYDQSYKDRLLGLEGRKLGIEQSKQAAADALNKQINDIILGGGSAPVAPSTPSLPYEDTQAQMTMMPQAAPQVNTALPTAPANNANVMMQLGALSKNPALVSYGKSLIEQNEQQKKDALNIQKDQMANQGIIDQASIVADSANDAINAIKSPTNFFTSGFGSGVASMIGGTSASDLESTINNIKSNEAIRKIMELKAGSKTGATGFGALNKEELTALQSSVANLDQKQSDEQLVKNLGIIKTNLSKLVKGAAPKAGVNPQDINDILNRLQSNPAKTINWSDL